jgi:hypothetical protein
MGPVLSDEIESDARGENGDGKRFLQLILLSRIDAAVQCTTKSLMNRDGTAWVYQGRYGVTTKLGKDGNKDSATQGTCTCRSLENHTVPVHGSESWRAKQTRIDDSGTAIPPAKESARPPTLGSTLLLPFFLGFAVRFREQGSQVRDFLKQSRLVAGVVI